MGIPVSGASYVYGESMSIIHITLKPECNVIAYHAINEFVAMGETLTRHIRLEDNPADLLTKEVTGHMRKHHSSLVLYEIYDGYT